LKKSQPGNPILISETNSQARITLRRAIAKLTDNPEDINFFRDVATAFDELKNLVECGIDVDLFVTDLYMENNFNIFMLIKEMEKSQKFWNIPLLIYTHMPDKEMFNRIRKDISHLPFRLLPITLDGNAVIEVCEGLLNYKKENSSYLTLESRFSDIVEEGEEEDIDKAMVEIDREAEKNQKVLHKAKVSHVKGKLYFDLFKRKSLEGDDNNKSIMQKAEGHFLTAHKEFPNFWEITFSLFTLYMGQGKIKEAKDYLKQLIEMFPEQSKYSFKMGKINELEGEFAEAVTNYLGAARSMIEEGVEGFEVDDIMEVVDASLSASKKMLDEMGLSKFTTLDKQIGTREYGVIKTLKQNNATTRNALLKLTKKVSDDPNIFNKIGITYRRTGDFKMALEMYGKALKLDSENPRIRINFSISLALFGSWKLADNEMSKAEELNRDNSDNDIIDKLKKIISQKDSKSLAKMLL